MVKRAWFLALVVATVALLTALLPKLAFDAMGGVPVPNVPTLAQEFADAARVKALIRGKRVVIVGGTAGLGLALASSLIERGAEVTVVGRRSPQALIDSLTPEQKNRLRVVSADLASLKTAQELVRSKLGDLTKVDLFVLTNGVFAGPKLERTSEGIEKDMAISFLSRQVMVNEIVSKVPDAFVFNMGCPGCMMSAVPFHLDDLNLDKKETPYESMPVHANTVLGNEALVSHLASTGKKIVGLNPGLIQTEIRDAVHGGTGTFVGKILESIIHFVSITPKQYAEGTLIPLCAKAFSGTLKSASLYNQRGQLIKPTAHFNDSLNAKKFYEAAEKIIKTVV